MSSDTSPGFHAEGSECAVHARLAKGALGGIGKLQTAVLQTAERDHGARRLGQRGPRAEDQLAEPLAPGQQLVDQAELGERVQLRDQDDEVGAVFVVEVEVTLQQRPRIVGSRGFVLGDEAFAVVEERLHDAADELLARGEVVVQRGLGDAEPIGDVLEAGALDALGDEQFLRDLLDALPGLRWRSTAHARSVALTYRSVSDIFDLPIVK